MSVFFDPFRSLTNEPFGQQFGSALLAGGSTGIPGLLSLWNAKTPSVCPVGPQIQTSVAGTQPDANGNMVPWPVNHPGRGVMVHPAFTKLGNNSVFDGAVAGSPGTTPTGWTYTVVDSPTMAVTDVEGENKLTFSGTASRGYLSLSQAVAALAVYTFDVMGAADGVLRYADFEYCSLTGGTIVVMKDGVVVADETAVPAAGTFKLSVKVTAGAVGDTAIFRFGLGASAIATGTVSVWQPQLVLGAYSMPYVRSTTGSVAVASTAATSLGIGAAIPLNAAMREAFQRSVTDGVELITAAADREFTADTGWWTKTNATIADGKCTIAVAGGSIVRTMLTAGYSYRVRFTIAGYTSGSAGISSSTTTTAGRLPNANGSFVLDIVANGGAPTVLGFVSTVAGVSFDNISIQRLATAVFTAAALAYLGASSTEVTADTNILAFSNAVTGGIYAATGGVFKASDGTNTATVTVAGGWARGETPLVAWKTNTAGTKMYIGYKKAADADITWGAEANYSGSVNPGTHVRWGYTIDKSLGAIQSQAWNRPVTNAEIVSLTRLAV